MNHPPKVSIVITSYLEKSKPYLDLCVRSIKNLDYPKELLEVIVVSPKWYVPTYEGVRTIHPDKEDYGNAHAMNVGLDATDPKSEYLLYANDDVVFTKNCLKNLLVTANMYQGGLFMPISNDQQQGRYNLMVALTDGPQVEFVEPGPKKIEEWAGKEDRLMNSNSLYPPGVAFMKTLCTYTFIMRRTMFMQLGPLTEFDTGPDDIDYCLRVGQLKHGCGIVLDALAWHAGGVSADVTMTDERRTANAKAFEAKWGFSSGEAVFKG